VRREPRRRVLEVAQKAHGILLERAGELRAVRRAQRRTLQSAEQRGRSLLRAVADVQTERVAGGEESLQIGVVRVVTVGPVRPVAAHAQRRQNARLVVASTLR
jgi:hypothetical protein